MESTGVPGRIHLSGFTAAYLQEHHGIKLEEGAIKPELEEQKARPQGDYEKLLEDLRDRYSEMSNKDLLQFPKYTNHTYLGMLTFFEDFKYF